MAKSKGARIQYYIRTPMSRRCLSLPHVKKPSKYNRPPRIKKNILRSQKSMKSLKKLNNAVRKKPDMVTCNKFTETKKNGTDATETVDFRFNYVQRYKNLK